ncbi:MAG: hypothetical protein ABIS84_01185 [Arachnia sp.]
MGPKRRHDDPSGRQAAYSILFPDAASESGSRTPVGHLSDLRLDHVLARLCVDTDADTVGRLFTRPLRDVATVTYRHAVFRDLDDEPVLRAVTAFRDEMDARQRILEQVARSGHRLQRQSLSLDAAQASSDAARTLAEVLGQLTPASEALRRLRHGLDNLVHSTSFTTSAATVASLQKSAAALRYAVQIAGGHVTVTQYDGQPDHGVEVRSTFARFAQQPSMNKSGPASELLRLDQVESRILDGVEALHPELFTARADFLASPDARVDPLITHLHGEVQFYLSWLDLIRPLRAAGLPFCLPRVTQRPSDVFAVEGFDLALALSAIPEGAAVVCNDFRLSGPEQMLVVTGPNNGGKTTFARMVGQLFHLTGLGVPVPGRSAQLTLPDAIHTHFEQEESSTESGRFQGELQRVHAILRDATGESVVILNESFSSTSLRDAVTVATRVVGTLLDCGCLGVYVTFMDEIAALGERTVSMVTRVAPDDPATRIFSLERAPADGHAHASAIAEKYGLTRERLLARMRP